MADAADVAATLAQLCNGGEFTEEDLAPLLGLLLVVQSDGRCRRRRVERRTQGYALQPHSAALFPSTRRRNLVGLHAVPAPEQGRAAAGEANRGGCRDWGRGAPPRMEERGSGAWGASWPVTGRSRERLPKLAQVP